ncbi:site-specific DNA-methyltransferase [Anabaena cylindrica FACHB-243]|uniref:site-specific DNA-methyltransferase n=1 Tax=Anabaena TaxID=1163 RepID=UPI0002E7C00A|nr:MULTISPECIES: site-specific DNA-methyltransferase [Anabaena]MBD2417774.1 site-specific DNA-methyltransferase [Anabaena cylindrica FACHB-243]MBY5285324.1 site-specific DNA-methyltransferase [Anabaena sp. CCAP 1446/1C]MBY5311602.1 site-specific DNA-methyltransferase [Anabaena sp. CCAP 1446/1C]MCM2404689.1 site-specific DNA-methyltransferase [Anabaena sp. CCAP 1446/1C]
MKPHLKTDNKKIWKPYSQSRQILLKNGYKANICPVGHEILEKLLKDNQVAISPNLLKIANTELNSAYLRPVNRRKKPHPVSYPLGFLEFFIQFVTFDGYLVLDT